MDVTDLRVYQISLKSFREIEQIAKELPRSLADTRRQILRSAKCIPPLIAEGFGRKRSQKEFRRFIIEAMSSSDETITHLRVIALSEFNKAPIERLREIAERYKSISKQLNRLSSTISKNIKQRSEI